MMMGDRPRYLFVTGRLAEFALRQVLDDLAPRAGFAAEVAVLPITVAALMTPKWVARHLEVPAEVEPAVSAGAELVLSVNAGNRDHAPDWGIEVVAIPDQPGSLEGFDQTVEFLARKGVPFRIDPIIEPIGFGFAASLGRYLEV